MVLGRGGKYCSEVVLGPFVVRNVLCEQGVSWSVWFDYHQHFKLKYVLVNMQTDLGAPFYL